MITCSLTKNLIHASQISPPFIVIPCIVSKKGTKLSLGQYFFKGISLYLLVTNMYTLVTNMYLWTLYLGTAPVTSLANIGGLP